MNPAEEGLLRAMRAGKFGTLSALKLREPKSKEADRLATKISPMDYRLSKLFLLLLSSWLLTGCWPCARCVICLRLCVCNKSSLIDVCYLWPEREQDVNKLKKFMRYRHILHAPKGSSTLSAWYVAMSSPRPNPTTFYSSFLSTYDLLHTRQAKHKETYDI